jgi:hypothetical protein
MSGSDDEGMDETAFREWVHDDWWKEDILSELKEEFGIVLESTCSKTHAAEKLISLKYPSSTVACASTDATKVCSSFRFANVKRRHKIIMEFSMKNVAFAKAHKDEIDALEPDVKSCTVCGVYRGCVFPFSTDADCKCLAHLNCSSNLREGNATHKFRCNHCVQRLATMKKKHKRTICATPIRKEPYGPVVYCCMEKGHLGLCN